MKCKPEAPCQGDKYRVKIFKNSNLFHVRVFDSLGNVCDLDTFNLKESARQRKRQLDRDILMGRHWN